MPLHIAASRGHLECVNCLIEAKAELDAPTALSSGGNTPLHLAISRNYTNVAMVLLHAGADFDLVFLSRVVNSRHDGGLLLKSTSGSSYCGRSSGIVLFLSLSGSL